MGFHCQPSDQPVFFGGWTPAPPAPRSTALAPSRRAPAKMLALSWASWKRDVWLAPDRPAACAVLGVNAGGADGEGTGVGGGDSPGKSVPPLTPRRAAQ